MAILLLTAEAYYYRWLLQAHPEVNNRLQSLSWIITLLYSVVEISNIVYYQLGELEYIRNYYLTWHPF